jgi:hypothetical protein
MNGLFRTSMNSMENKKEKNHLQKEKWSHILSSPNQISTLKVNKVKKPIFYSFKQFTFI